MPARYPAGSLQALLDGGLVTPATRAALRRRLAEPPVTQPRFFDPLAWQVLAAACARLLPQPPGERVDVPGAIDTRLAKGEGDGWRYADLPPDGDACRRGLHALDSLARARYGQEFAGLSGERQDELLGMVQTGQVSGPAWAGLPPARFFEELLAEVVETYYGHPLGQEDIGCVAAADAHGWQRLGLNQREAHEPVADD